MTEINLTPFDTDEGVALVEPEGSAIVEVTLGDEETVGNFLQANPTWSIAEQVNDTYILFDGATFDYRMVYPSRKVSGTRIPDGDLITATRIFSSFTGVRFYLVT